MDYSPLQPPQFNVVTSVETLFPNKVTLWGPGGQDSNIAFWGGDTIQLITKTEPFVWECGESVSHTVPEDCPTTDFCIIGAIKYY